MIWTKSIYTKPTSNLIFILYTAPSYALPAGAFNSTSHVLPFLSVQAKIKSNTTGNIAHTDAQVNMKK